MTVRDASPAATDTSGRESEMPVRKGLDEAVDHEGVEAAITLHRIVPGGLQRLTGDWPVGFAQHRHQTSADLTIGAGPGLASARWSVVLRIAGRSPIAVVRDRAGVAAR